jgi:hypothetical protein
MKAGTYYIGDLCYILHNRWDEFCSITIDGNSCKDGEFKFEDGVEFASYETAYGDGFYTDQYGHDFPVDAGLIGCIETKYIHPEELKNLSMGAVIEFKESFPTFSSDGVIVFGDIVIDTN